MRDYQIRIFAKNELTIATPRIGHLYLAGRTTNTKKLIIGSMVRYFTATKSKTIGATFLKIFETASNSKANITAPKRVMVINFIVVMTSEALRLFLFEELRGNYCDGYGVQK